MANRCVFLDRDGVIIRDVHLLTSEAGIELCPGAPAALAALKQAGYLLVVVTNQTVIARGLVTEEEVDQIHLAINRRLINAGGAEIDRFYTCPHHPGATLERYRQNCACRKPHPGLVEAAARELKIDPVRSFLVGDRLSDITAGAAAGCRTVLVETGAHLAPPIETATPQGLPPLPDHTCSDLAAAARWILEQP